MAFQNKGAMAATVVVAASNSFQNRSGNYVCPGANDHLIIQEALDALPATGGCIFLLDGTYTLGAQVARAIDNVKFIGCGAGTIINWNGVNPVITAGVQNNWLFSHFATDAGGVDIAGAAQSAIRNIWIAGVRTRLGKSDFEWTVDKLLKGAGPGADPDEIDVPVSAAEYVVGDILILSADVQSSSPPATYTKKKEIRIATGGALRIKFDLYGTSVTYGINGRIYRNGVAIGTEQSNTEASFTTYSEDIDGWSNGDLCQFYVKYISQTHVNSKAKNFRIYIVKKLYDAEVILDT